MSYYNTGTIAVTNGSTAVTGTGTAWVNTIFPGDVLIGPGGVAYVIASVASNTSLTLARAYLGTTASGQAYDITYQGGRDVAVTATLNALITSFQSVVDNAGAGIFPDGTASLPGLRFSGDLNTGVRRIGADRVGIVGNGADMLDLTASTGAAAGSAVRTTRADTSLVKLLTAAALGWGGTGAMDLAPSNDFDALRMGGPWRLDPSTVGGIALNAVGFHLNRASGNGAGNHVQVAFDTLGAMYQRYMLDGAGAWSAWRRVHLGTTLNFNSNLVGFDRITIADDAVGLLTPPRPGGRLSIVCNGHGNFPLAQHSALIFFDTGSTLEIIKEAGGSALDVVTTDLVVAGDGTDARVTVAARTGQVKILNRSGGTGIFDVAFL